MGNTMVIGTYFGAQGSFDFYAAIIVFTLLTLAYSLKGGMSSSIFTDAIQMVLFSILLIIILWKVFSMDGFSVSTVATSSLSFEWD
jgi:Na+/proline symporter